jgi:ABC transporter DrrB family efflux protein
MGMVHSSEERFFDPGKIYAIIRKNWMVLSRDTLRLRMLILFPLVMIIIFGYTAGRVPTNVPGAIVDYDNSQTSRSIQAELYANNLFSIKHLYGSQDEGRRAIESGDIKILFIIPAGFEKDIQSGRTGAISIILDESDPTIAQITRATTDAFIQRISEGIKTSRLSAISAAARQNQVILSLAACSSADNQEEMARIQSAFADARLTYSGTDSALSGTAQALRNALGQVYDPNAAIASINNNTADSGASIFLIATSVQKQPALDQIAFYRGLQGANAKLFRDTSSIYSDSNLIYANALQQRSALYASCNAMDSASQSFGQIADSAAAASSDAVVSSEIEPYGSGRKGLDFLIPSILALIVFQGAVMGMGRAIAGERKDGSLTRVFLTPTSNVTIISGTLLFYILFETLRSSLIVIIAMLVFGVLIKGSVLSIVFLISIYAAGATGLGMILSVLSKSQEQYMALAMLITLPTLFLAGVFLPIETMPPLLQGVTHILPITYASDALRGVMIKGFAITQVIPDVMFLAGFAALTLALSVLLFKRELI